MGVNPPMSMIDAPIAVADNVWPMTQYKTCVSSGLEDAYRQLLPPGLIAPADYVFPASAAASLASDKTLTIRSSGSATNSIWLAPEGTAQFTAGPTMTQAQGDATSIAIPSMAGSYRVFVVDAQGKKLGQSAAQLRVK
jgi:hypothetical protein